MIELRWVERYEMAHHLGDNIMQKVKVLQYRRQLPPKMITENGSITGLESQWSDWIDVPTVTEG